MKYVFMIPYLLGLMNLYPVIKFRRWGDKEWYKDNLTISLWSLAICSIIGSMLFIIINILELRYD